MWNKSQSTIQTQMLYIQGSSATLYFTDYTQIFLQVYTKTKWTLLTQHQKSCYICFFFFIRLFFLPPMSPFLKLCDWKLFMVTLEELGRSWSALSSDRDSIIASAVSTEELSPAASTRSTSNFTGHTSLRFANLFWTEMVNNCKVKV